MIILDSAIGNYITLNNKRYSCFAGNNYLGLASHPSIKEASILSIEKYGINFSASRQTTGTADIHIILEKLLSEYKNKKDSVVFASGYLGNEILLHSIENQYNAIFFDEFSHPSILDGFPRSIQRTIQYNHCNVEHLESLLKKNQKYKPLIITDGIFSLTGEIAPLDKIIPIAKAFNAILVIDDAHSTGILGENGRGTPEYFHLDQVDNIYQTETLSKALGAYGGFISGSEGLIRTIREKSTVYQASTALPPPIVAAGCAALRLLSEQPGLRKMLHRNAKRLKQGIVDLGFNTTYDQTPIIPVFFDSHVEASNLSGILEENNIIVPCINYPVKLNRFMVRITASASHTEDQISELLNVLKMWRDKYGIYKN
jgi:7-keto-8-aminopelargonate synthetase-like enzyme